MIQVHAFNPNPLLRHCIDSYLIISADHTQGFIEKNLLPQTTQCLVFGLDDENTVYDCIHDEFCPRHFIAGPNDTLCRVKLFPGMKKMIVNFKPGGYYKIFRQSAHLFNNRSQDAIKFLGKQIAELGSCLKKSPLSGKIELMDSWLKERLQNQKKGERNIDDSIQMIVRTKGNISLMQLEQATYTTKRTLERHFLEQVGLHPKTFSRLIRFTAVIRYVETNPHVKWRQLADVFGYYDQSHFIHEFKSLTGRLPNDYFTAESGFTQILQI